MALAPPLGDLALALALFPSLPFFHPHRAHTNSMTGNLLAIPPKTSPLASSALTQAVRTHIAENFRDAHPDAFARDLQTLAGLRDQVACLDGHSSGVAVALK